MSQPAGADVVERAIASALRSGADAADALLGESDSIEARVRGEESDFVKQAREWLCVLHGFLQSENLACFLGKA